MKISLVIPAYNEEKYLSRCLTAALKNGREIEEVIVVDNASTDKTTAIADSFSSVKVASEPRKGLTKARQRGLQAATSELIAYNDADTEMPPGWSRKVLRHFSQDERIVCVSGPYIYYDQSSLNRLLVWAYWLLLAYPAYFLTGYLAVGGNFAVRKQAVEKIGGFDESISFYGEDTDIARRLAKVGKVKFYPSLYMYTSARRFKGEGLFKVAAKYVINFLSQVWRGKPAHQDYKDIR